MRHKFCSQLVKTFRPAVNSLRMQGIDTQSLRFVRSLNFPSYQKALGRINSPRSAILGNIVTVCHFICEGLFDYRGLMFAFLV
jgi:hypothetical protein